MKKNELTTCTVLLVEDEQTLRKLLGKQLRQLGYEVLEAENGRNALCLSEQNENIALLITDIMMPGMNGIQLAEKIRQNEPELPVLFISGYLHDESADFNRLDGNVFFLRKPFTLRVLADKVEGILASAS